MTIDKARVTEIVFSTIGELNRELGKSQQLERSLSTVLSGKGSRLDSLAIVSLQMILEEKVGEALDVDMQLDFDRFLDSAGEDTRTVADLIDHLLPVLNQDATP